MTQRTTPEAVRGLCPTTLTDISGPLRMAFLLVDRVYPNIDDEPTELIERYLAAHYVALLDPREQSASSAVGNLRVVYEGRMKTEGMTTYLQTAWDMDATGRLKQLMLQQRRVSFQVF